MLNPVIVKKIMKRYGVEENKYQQFVEIVQAIKQYYGVKAFSGYPYADRYAKEVQKLRKKYSLYQVNIGIIDDWSLDHIGFDGDIPDHFDYSPEDIIKENQL